MLAAKKLMPWTKNPMLKKRQDADKKRDARDEFSKGLKGMFGKKDEKPEEEGAAEKQDKVVPRARALRVSARMCACAGLFSRCHTRPFKRPSRAREQRRLLSRRRCS